MAAQQLLSTFTRSYENVNSIASTSKGLRFCKNVDSFTSQNTKSLKVVSQKNGDETTRRDVLLAASSIALSIPTFPDVALADKAPKGFSVHQDNIDKYFFLFPFGWQEVSVRGLDITYKDVIEPLESVSVNIIKTDKETLEELGPANEIANTLVERVLTGPNQKSSLVSVEEREVNGRKYYTFEFVAKTSNYTRHALSTVALGNGKFYTLTTGANERRWPKMEEKLKLIANSFTLL